MELVRLTLLEPTQFISPLSGTSERALDLKSVISHRKMELMTIPLKGCMEGISVIYKRKCVRLLQNAVL